MRGRQILMGLLVTTLVGCGADDDAEPTVDQGVELDALIGGDDMATPDPDMATPDMAVPDPDMAVPDPDMATPDPDMAVPDPDMATPDPDMAVPDPDMARPDPDMAPPDPDMAVPDPDMAAPDPDMAVPDPDMARPDPDMAPPDPDMAVPDPDMAAPDPDMAPPDPDMGPPVGYPPGPYGLSVGSVIANLAFIDGDGQPYTLEDARNTPGARLIFLATVAGWCPTCRAKMPAVAAAHRELGGRGLVSIVDLYENANFAPAQARDAAEWARREGLTNPVVADPMFVVAPYFPPRAGREHYMLIDAASMEILHLERFWNTNESRQRIEDLLR